MSEKYLLIEEESLNYEGYFLEEEVNKMIEQFFKERGYNVNVETAKTVEEEKIKVKEDKLIIDKEFSEYIKIVIELKKTFVIEGEELVMINNEKTKMKKGRVKVVIRVTLETDYEGKYESPLLFLFRWLMDNFIMKKYIERYKKESIRDVKEFFIELKYFFGMLK